MKTGRTLNRVRRLAGQFPRRLGFEQLESRQMLSTWGGADAAAGTAAVPGDDPGPTTVLIRLQATDLCGQPIDRVAVGDEFWLEVYVQDLRPAPEGVFAAYLDVNYDAALVSPGSGEDAGLIFGTTYVNGKSGEFLPGVIDEAGAFAGFDQTYGDEYLVFAVPLTATATGIFDFAGSAADPIGHDVLVYGSDYPVPWEEVRVLGAQLIVAAGAAADQAGVGGVADADGSLVCRGALVGGSGADLATAKPLAGPWKRPTYEPYFPPESDAPPKAYEPEETIDLWTYDDAKPAESDPNASGGWADDVWLSRSPIIVVPVAIDWGWGDYVYDASGSLQDVIIPPSSAGSYQLSMAGWSFSAARSDFIVTFSEPLGARLDGWSFEVLSGSELTAVVPAGSSSPEAAYWYAFETLEARNAGSPVDVASVRVSDVGGTDGNNAWLPDAFPGWTVPAGPELPLADDRGRPAAEHARAGRVLARLAVQLHLPTSADQVDDLLPAILLDV